jgi:hypothetical protein
MLRFPKAVKDWEDEYIRNTPVNIEQNLRILDGLYEYAKNLGVLPAKDPLENLEFKIGFVKRLKSVSGPPPKNRRDS